MKFKIFHPNKEIFYLVCPVNPSVYARFAKYVYKVYPRYNCVRCSLATKGNIRQGINENCICVNDISYLPI